MSGANLLGGQENEDGSGNEQHAPNNGTNEDEYNSESFDWGNGIGGDMGRNEDPPLDQGDLLRQEGARTEPMPRGAGEGGGNNDVGGGGNNNGGGRPNFTAAGVVPPVPNVATNNAQQAQGAGGNGPAQGGAAGMAGGAVPLATTPTPPPAVVPKWSGLGSAITGMGQRVTTLDFAVQELVSQHNTIMTASTMSTPSLALVPPIDKGYDAFVDFLSSASSQPEPELFAQSETSEIEAHSFCTKIRPLSAPQAIPNDDDRESIRSIVEDVKIGSVMPEFTLTCLDGQEHKLSDFRGSKVMLCFYSFSTCPICAYSVTNLIGNYKKLAWASKLKVITVFQTNLDYLKIGLTKENSPIPRLTNSNLYPFLALADPDGTAASTFKIEDGGWIKTGMDTVRIWSQIVSGYHSTCNLISAVNVMEELRFLGGATMLPSEFLMDEEGVLVDVLRAEKRIESMTMDRITNFLLFGGRPAPAKKDLRRSSTQTFTSGIGSEKNLKNKEPSTIKTDAAKSERDKKAYQRNRRATTQ